MPRSIRLSLFGLVLASRAVAQSDTAVTLREGLIVHPSRETAYVMTPEGGVAAVDLRSGRPRWSTRSAAKPLALVDDQLAAQVEPRARTNRLEIVSLNAAGRGVGQVKRRSVLDLPARVQVAIGETKGSTFTTHAHRAGTDVVVAWTFIGEDRTERGAVRHDVRRGRLAHMDSLPAQLEHAARANWMVTPAERIAGAAPTQYLSADRRYVLASERTGDDRVWDKYRWTIYERASGRRAGEHRSHWSFLPFVVRDSLLIYETTPHARFGEAEQPAKLRAFSLSTGREVWAFPVREVVMRGQAPP